jgi:hypothetical protein
MGFLSNLFAAPGSGYAQGAMNNTNKLAATQAGLFNQYAPGAMAQLQGIANNGMTPAITAGLNQGNAQAYSGMTNALGAIDTNMAGRGLTQSSFANNAAQGAGATYQGVVGQNNQNAENMASQRQMQAIMAMLQNSGYMGQGAMSGYGNVSNMGNQESANFMQAVGGVGSFIGSALMA